MDGWIEIVVSKHFGCKDLLCHPTETTVNGCIAEVFLGKVPL